MNNGEKVLADLFEHLLGPLVTWAAVLVLAAVLVVAAYLWVVVVIA